MDDKLKVRLALAYHLAEFGLALAVLGVVWSSYWAVKRPKLVVCKPRG